MIITNSKYTFPQIEEFLLKQGLLRLYDDTFPVNTNSAESLIQSILYNINYWGRATYYADGTLQCDGGRYTVPLVTYFVYAGIIRRFL